MAADPLLPTHCSIWRVSHVLLDWLVRNIEVVRGASILELGAGTGLVSIAACKLGAKSVTATDGEEHALDLIRANARENGTVMDVLKWDWRTAPPPRLCDTLFDLVVASDCIYSGAAPSVLAENLLHLRAKRILFIQEVRETPCLSHMVEECSDESECTNALVQSVVRARIGKPILHSSNNVPALSALDHFLTTCTQLGIQVHFFQLPECPQGRFMMFELVLPKTRCDG